MRPNPRELTPDEKALVERLSKPPPGPPPELSIEDQLEQKKGQRRERVWIAVFFLSGIVLHVWAIFAMGWSEYYAWQKRLLDGLPLFKAPLELQLANPFTFILPAAVFSFYRLARARAADRKAENREAKRRESASSADAPAADAVPGSSNLALELGSGLLTAVSYFLVLVSIGAVFVGGNRLAPPGYLFAMFVLALASAPSVLLPWVLWMIPPEENKDFVPLQARFVGIHFVAVVLWMAYLSLA